MDLRAANQSAACSSGRNETQVGLASDTAMKEGAGARLHEGKRSTGTHDRLRIAKEEVAQEA